MLLKKKEFNISKRKCKINLDREDSYNLIFELKKSDRNRNSCNRDKYNKKCFIRENANSKNRSEEKGNSRNKCKGKESFIFMIIRVRKEIYGRGKG
jgi:hypothetical protein